MILNLSAHINHFSSDNLRISSKFTEMLRKRTFFKKSQNFDKNHEKSAFFDYF